MSYRYKHQEKEYWVKESAKWGVEVHDLQTDPREVIFSDRDARKLLSKTLNDVLNNVGK
jgi:hypothetical protein